MRMRKREIENVRARMRKREIESVRASMRMMKRRLE